MSNHRISWEEAYEGYLREGDPGRVELAKNWACAIGLQDVDGLRVSDYLIELAMANIEGRLTMDEVREKIEMHYRRRKTDAPC